MLRVAVYSPHASPCPRQQHPHRTAATPPALRWTAFSSELPPPLQTRPRPQAARGARGQSDPPRFAHTRQKPRARTALPRPVRPLQNPGMSLPRPGQESNGGQEGPRLSGRRRKKKNNNKKKKTARGEGPAVPAAAYLRRRAGPASLGGRTAGRTRPAASRDPRHRARVATAQADPPPAVGPSTRR